MRTSHRHSLAPAVAAAAVAGCLVIPVSSSSTTASWTAIASGGGGTASTAPGGPRSIWPDRPTAVTLPTGDRVTFGGGRGVSLDRARSRPGVEFKIWRWRGRTHVVPLDALRLVASGRVDHRLFDLQALAKQARVADDGRLHVVATSDGAARASAALAARSAAAAGASVDRRLPSIGGAAISLSPSRAADVWADLTAGASRSRRLDGGIDTLWLDAVLQPSLDESVPQIGAPAAWQSGLTGNGVKVAVLDSGVDESHPDLATRIVASENFTNESGRDLVGHGTHVASTIAGTGVASGGRYRGVAPGATLLDGKVCELFGCRTSAIVAGMEWAVDNGAAVVNLSLGGMDEPGVDPVERSINRLSARFGTLFVASAGNDGFWGRETVGSPASADAALAVGAVDKRDRLAYFSSRGPRTGGAAVKPEIVAPGVIITAARSSEASTGEKRYLTASGTSMAAPHVAGAAAIVAQQHPRWTGQQLKALLVGSAHSLGLSVFKQGAGRLDVAAAVELSAMAAPATLRLGIQRWPHDDDQPVTRRLTYHNTDDKLVTFDLELEARGPKGQAVPEGAIGLDRQLVTIPVGGSETVVLTADTAIEGPEGIYSGVVVAKAGGQTIRTPWSVEKEAEHHIVTIEHTGFDGQPTSDALPVLAVGPSWRPPSPFSEFAVPRDGIVRLRLPVGEYLIDGYIYGDRRVAQIHASIDLRDDMWLDFDARDAKPIALRLPADPKARLAAFHVDYQRDFGAGITWSTGYGFLPPERLYSLYLGKRLAPDALFSQASAIWVRPGRRRAFADSPRWYAVTWDLPGGRLPTGIDRTVRSRDLTHEIVQIHDLPGPEQPLLGTSAHGFGDDLSTVARFIPYRTPAKVEMYFSPNHAWHTVLGDSAGNYLEGLRTYASSQRTRTSWGRAVLAPALPTGAVRRLGDTVWIDIPVLTDQAGHGGINYLGSRTKLWYGGELLRDLLGTTWHRIVGVPSEQGRLRIATSVDVPQGTSIDAVWELDSAHVDGDDPQALPMSTIRFAPDVGLANRAKAGTTMTMPIRVAPQPGSDAGTVRTLALQVSYDDGKRWRRVRVHGDGHRWTAKLRHPVGARFVSLRARTTDTEGNTAKLTVIHAYGLKAGR